MRHFGGSGAVLALLTLACVPAAGQSYYTAADVNFAANGALPYAVNDAGQVAGTDTVYVAGGYMAYVAFVWSPAEWGRYLPTLGGIECSAYAINRSGLVVGWSDVPGETSRHACLWDAAGRIQDLGTLTGMTSSEARAINEKGQVAGFSSTADGHTHAFLWTPGGTDGVPDNPQTKDLGTLGGTSSWAYGINSDGTVVAALAPSGLTAAAVSSSQINLAWTNNATSATGVAIERSRDGSTFVEIVRVGQTINAYANTRLKGGTTYWYRVRAFAEDGYSGYSNVASAKTPTTRKR